MAAEISYEELKKEYDNFTYPIVQILVENQELNQTKTKLQVGEIEVEVSSGYEAGIASFVIYGCYDRVSCSFDYSLIKKFVMLGAQVSIRMGYLNVVKEVFCGFISQVNFFFEQDEIPGVRVNCMDVKGMMMASCSSRQMTATCYSDAVQSIFSQQHYTQMQERGIIQGLSITQTPDKETAAGAVSDRSVEMAAESDYEFVVKAAKKFNYEFFVSGGVVYFRKAKNYTSILMEISPATGMRNVDVAYSITGLAGKIEVRSTDVGKAKQIASSVKLNNKISASSHAAKLVKNVSKVYIDPTADSKQTAGYRADYLAEEISYRFGTLEVELVGLPDMVVGRFIQLNGLGDPADNVFYVTNVRHQMNEVCGFSTKITAKASGLGGVSALGAGSAVLSGVAGGI